tara:strand:+ start:3250 stop:3843 length:594 start_codon:yes stop_codon:yes gene_type:complete
MANVSAPFGFSQYSGTGSAPTYEQNVGFCAYNTAAMYYGDPVFQNSNGSVYPTSPGTGILAGVFVGAKYLSVSQKRTVWSNFWGAADVAAANTVEVYIVNDPNARFLAQVGGSSSTGLATTDIGANVQFAYGTPNTMSGISGAYIDITVTPTTTATLPFKFVGLVTNPPGANGTEAGAYNYAVVAFNNVVTKTLTGI